MSVISRLTIRTFIIKLFGKKNPLDKKYKAIRSYEWSWAYSVATSLRSPRRISVWEVLMPVFLIFNFVKTKGDTDFLAKNFLFTKEMALNAAFDILENQKTKMEVLQGIKEKTDNLIQIDEHGLYSEEIQQSQHSEIDLLIDHYIRLLNAQGKDYQELVRSAYANREEFSGFIQELIKLEKQVNIAALNTLGPRGNREFVDNVEAHSQRVRLISLDRIFGKSDQP